MNDGRVFTNYAPRDTQHKEFLNQVKNLGCSSDLKFQQFNLNNCAKENADKIALSIKESNKNKYKLNNC